MPVNKTNVILGRLTALRFGDCDTSVASWRCQCDLITRGMYLETGKLTECHCKIDNARAKFAGYSGSGHYSKVFFLLGREHVAYQFGFTACNVA